MLEKVVVRWQSQCKFKYEQETSKKKAVTNRSNSGTYLWGIAKKLLQCTKIITCSYP